MRENAEWTNRIVTTVEAGKEVSVRRGVSTNIVLISYLLVE